MKGCTALADLVGLDEPLDPASMRFTVKVAKSCRSCLFNGQRASVCFAATAVAKRSDLPDCDLGFVYVPIPIDERQLTID
jgi:hypothetical protein